VTLRQYLHKHAQIYSPAGAIILATPPAKFAWILTANQVAEMFSWQLLSFTQNHVAIRLIFMLIVGRSMALALAQAGAHIIGITDPMGDLLPEDKVRAMEKIIAGKIENYPPLIPPVLPCPYTLSKLLFATFVSLLHA